jgi:hypothetical protein
MVKSSQALVNEKERGTRQFLAKHGEALISPTTAVALALPPEPSHFALSLFASLTFRAPFRK